MEKKKKKKKKGALANSDSWWSCHVSLRRPTTAGSLERCPPGGKIAYRRDGKLVQERYRILSGKMFGTMPTACPLGYLEWHQDQMIFVNPPSASLKDSVRLLTLAISSFFKILSTPSRGNLRSFIAQWRFAYSIDTLGWRRAQKERKRIL